MTINYIKYFDPNDNPCNKIQFFSSYMNAYERRNEVLRLKEKYGDDVFYDVSFDTYPGHIL